MTAKRLPLIRMPVQLAAATPPGSPSQRGRACPSPGPATALDAVDVGHRPVIMARQCDRFGFSYIGYTQFPNLVRIPGSLDLGLGVRTAGFWISGCPSRQPKPVTLIASRDAGARLSCRLGSTRRLVRHRRPSRLPFPITPPGAHGHGRRQACLPPATRCRHVCLRRLPNRQGRAYRLRRELPTRRGILLRHGIRLGHLREVALHLPILNKGNGQSARVTRYVGQTCGTLRGARTEPPGDRWKRWSPTSTANSPSRA
jgi:hypothetical protein